MATIKTAQEMCQKLEDENTKLGELCEELKIPKKWINENLGLCYMITALEVKDDDEVILDRHMGPIIIKKNGTQIRIWDHDENARIMPIENKLFG